MKTTYSIIIFLTLFSINIQCTSLQEASEKGDVKEVNNLINNGTNVNEINKYGKTAIDRASKYGHIEVVKILLDKGANPNDGIHCAVYSGNTKLVQLLLDKGANINLNKSNINPFEFQDLNYYNHLDELTPLAFSAYLTTNIEMLKYLISNGASIDDSIVGLESIISSADKEDYKATNKAKNAITQLEKLKTTVILKKENKTKIAFKVKKYNGEKEMIAVIDFTTKDVPQSITYNVSELIRTEIINTNKYTVIERSRMNEILKEQGFQQSGCTDTSCAVQIGKLLSARKILVGSVMKVGNSLIISGRIVDVEKGIAEEGATGKCKSIDELDSGVIDFLNNLTDL